MIDSNTKRNLADGRIDAGDFLIFPANEIASKYSKFIGNESKFHNQDFQHQLSSFLKSEFPDIYALAQEIKKRVLTEPKFVVVTGLDFNSLLDETRDLFILSVTSSIGYATPTDQVNKKVLWPVKAVKNPTHTNSTFSQRLGEAAYHTDTQYFEFPEEAFSLWCIEPDKNKQGVNGLISADYIIGQINKRTDSSEILKTLTQTKFPFRVPSVFTGTASDDKVEYFLGNVLSQKPKIRYRKETIEKGVLASGIQLTKEQKHAIEVIEEIINKPSEELKLLLRKGEVIFVNNHELLHNRSDFQDPNRHLIRVRMAL